MYYDKFLPFYMTYADSSLYSRERIQGVKDFITKEFGAYAVEMEGAAIAQAAYLNNVPFLVIRAISDKADGSAEMDYPTFEAQAAEHSFKLTLRILKDIQG